MEAEGTGFGLEADAVRAAASLWVPSNAHHAAGDVSPLHARSLAGLPPALVITAQDDPLRDEGRAYARRLQDEGVDVTERCEPGLPHGFFQGHDLTDPAAAAATARRLADVAALLRG
jgi:acetyl esterase